MSCEHCVKHVTTALKAIDGITQVDVYLNTETATIETTDLVLDEEIRKAIDEAGYEVAGIEML